MQSETKVNSIYRRLHNFLGDLRYGRPLYGSIPSRYADLGANSTENSSYLSLKQIFEGAIRPDDVLVDVGCGRGRVINWWLSQGLSNRMVGIELDENIATETRHRLRRFDNVEIIAGDAVEQLPQDASLIYLYNPFDARVMHTFKSRVKDILVHSNRNVTKLIYLNCKHLNVFEQDPHCSIKKGEALYPFAVIEIRVV
jgi:SAM-dependent methyltransferase